MQDGWFDGLPYPLADARPQGFLGRNLARHHATALHVSENPDDWSDDDILHVLSSVGFDLPGNLILGDAAYRQFLEQGATRTSSAVSEQDIRAAYSARATLAMAHGDARSSAAGEFPKFTVFRDKDGMFEDVIVKFSGADNSAAVRRWADLLVCEHLALRVLESDLDIAAARSQIYQFAGRTFLKVVRFDRHGISGRSAVCTLQSLNAALLGTSSSSWARVAGQMLKEKLISAETARTSELLWWFGKLIGNSDMHDGNLAFREFKPLLPLPVQRELWREAAVAAIGYWPEMRKRWPGQRDIQKNLY